MFRRSKLLIPRSLTEVFRLSLVDYLRVIMIFAAYLEKPIFELAELKLDNLL